MGRRPGMTTVLLTSGRMPKALEVARALTGAGCRVVVSDPLGDHLCRASRHVARSVRVRAPNDGPEEYLLDMLDHIAEERVNVVVPISEEAMHAAGLAGRLPDGVRLFCEDRTTLLGLHDKLRFAERAGAWSLTAAEGAQADTPKAAALAAAGPVVRKRRFSSAGVSVVLPGAPVPDGADGPDWMVQRFVDGAHVSTCSLFDRGRVIGTAAYRGTVMDGTVAVAFERIEEPDSMRAWIERFGAFSKLTGFGSFDFILDAAGTPIAIECNPRITSGVHFFDSADLARAILDPAGTETIGFKPRRRFQQFFPCLTAVYGQVFRPKRFLRDFREMATSRDVLWRGDDPWPLISMTWTSREILWRALRRRCSLGEAATMDVGWFGAAGGG